MQIRRVKCLQSGASTSLGEYWASVSGYFSGCLSLRLTVCLGLTLRLMLRAYPGLDLDLCLGLRYAQA